MLRIFGFTGWVLLKLLSAFIDQRILDGNPENPTILSIVMKTRPFQGNRFPSGTVVFVATMPIKGSGRKILLVRHGINVRGDRRPYEVALVTPSRIFTESGLLENHANRRKSVNYSSN